MFAEAALENDLPLVRRLWDAAFARLDGDGDGLVSEADLHACLAALGTAVATDGATAMLMDAASGKCNSSDLLRLVLKGEAGVLKKRASTAGGRAAA